MKCQQKSWTGFIVDLVSFSLRLAESLFEDVHAMISREYSFNSSLNATVVRVTILDIAIVPVV
jgi:hypothetical protein